MVEDRAGRNVVPRKPGEKLFRVTWIRYVEESLVWATDADEAMQRAGNEEDFGVRELSEYNNTDFSVEERTEEEAADDLKILEGEGEIFEEEETDERN